MQRAAAILERLARRMASVFKPIEAVANSVSRLFSRVASASNSIARSTAKVAADLKSVAASLAAIDKIKSGGSSLGTKVAGGVAAGTAEGVAALAAGPGLSKLWASIAGSSATVAASAATAAAPMAATATATASTAASSGAVLGAVSAMAPAVAVVAAAVAGVYLQWTLLEKVLGTIGSVISTVAETISAVATTSAAIVNPWTYIDAAVAAATASASALRGMVESVASVTRDVFVSATEAVVAGWQRLTSLAKSAGSALVSGLTSAASAAGALLSRAASVASTLQGMAQSVVGPLTDAADKFAEAGDSIYLMSQQSGQSAQFLSEMAYAAERVGVSTEAIADAAKQAGGDAAVMAIARELEAIQDPAARAAAAIERFGEGGDKLLPLLSSGPGALQRMREEAAALGLTFSGPAAQSAHALALSYKAVKDGLQGLWQSIGQAVAPAITDWNGLVVGAIKGAISWVRANQPLIASVFSIAEKVATAGAVIATLAGSLGGVLPTVLGVAAAAGAGAAIWSRYGDSIRTFASPAIDLLGQMYTSVSRVVGGVTDAIRGARFDLAIEIAVTGMQAAWIAGLQSLASITGTAMGGILQSLAAGEWAAAGTQIWAQLQIAWTQGVGELGEVWQSLEGVFDTVVTYLKKAWNDALTMMGEQLDKLSAKAVAVLEAVKSYDPTGTIGKAQDALRGMQNRTGWTPGEGANAALDAGLAQRQAGRDAAAAQADAARQATIADLRRQAEEARGGAGGRADARGAELQAKLATALAAAEKARKEAALPDLKRTEIDKEEKKKREKAAKVESTATFSAAALLAVSGRGQPRIEKLAEKQIASIDKNGEKLDKIEKAIAMEFVA